MADPDKRSAGPAGQFGSTFQLIKDYAKQETIGPLRNAGRFLLWGAIGAVLLGGATVLLVLGTLRLVQTEFAPTFSGRWMSLLPYVFAIVVALVVIGIAVSRIGKTTLDPSQPAPVASASGVSTSAAGGVSTSAVGGVSTSAVGGVSTSAVGGVSREK
jgi:hypothetical protein